jgi:plasmid stabilization system protein ParE
MDLHKQLAQNKNAIIKLWFETLMDTYPADTAQFLRSQKDAFANPVGQNSLQSLKDIFDHIIEKFDPRTARSIIDPIIRIRAIQDFTPAEAVRFVFDLKTVIEKTIQSGTNGLTYQRALYHRIDRLGLLAFDVYMQCREKIYDLKANEMRKRTFKAFDRAGLIKEPDDEPSS